MPAAADQRATGRDQHRRFRGPLTVFSRLANSVRPSSAGHELPAGNQCLRRRLHLFCWTTFVGRRTRLAARRTLPQLISTMMPTIAAGIADLDSAVPANGPRIGASIRASSGTPMLSPGALAVWDLPLRPPLPRAALNRGGAAREDLRECRRPTTRSGKLQRH